MQKQNHPTNIDRMILIVYLIRQIQNSFGNLSLSSFLPAHTILPCRIFLSFCFTGKSNRGRTAFGYREVPDPFVAFVFPGALDTSGCGMINGIDMTEAFVGDGFHNDVLESRICGIRSNSCDAFPNPFANDAVSIVVKAVHASRSHSAFYHIAVPAFPNRGCAVVDGIKPARILSLEQEIPGDVCHSVFREGRHKD